MNGYIYAVWVIDVELIARSEFKRVKMIKFLVVNIVLEFLRDGVEPCDLVIVHARRGTAQDRADFVIIGLYRQG